MDVATYNALIRRNRRIRERIGFVQERVLPVLFWVGWAGVIGNALGCASERRDPLTGEVQDHPVPAGVGAVALATTLILIAVTLVWEQRLTDDELRWRQEFDQASEARRERRKVTCPECGTTNRVLATRRQAKCGKCGATLAPAQPEEVDALAVDEPPRPGASIPWASPAVVSVVGVAGLALGVVQLAR